MNDAKDRILDICLEEVHGGQMPPDLTSQVMQLFHDQSIASHGNGDVASSHGGITPSLAARASAVPPAGSPSTAASPAVKIARKRPAQRIASVTWLNVALAASILVAVVSVGALAFRLIDRSRSSENSLATSPKDNTRTDGDNGLVATQGDNKKKARSRQDDAPAIGDGRLVKRPGSVPDKVPSTDLDREGNANPESTHQLATQQDHGSRDADVVALINNEMQANWQKHKIVPAVPVDDETWCRRAFASILGRAPTSDELAAFLADDRSQNSVGETSVGETSVGETSVAGTSVSAKRVALVDRLLTDPACKDQFAARFASLWNDLLIGPVGGRRKGDLASRDGLRQYLERSFSTNKPLDDLARELISATGSGKPGTANFNGAANFLLAHVDGRGITATAHTARVFLESRVKCAQCHDYAAGGQQLAQREFWQLNSFFRQVDFQRGAGSDEFALVNRDFDGEGDDPHDAEVYFETPDERLRVAYPVLGNQSIPTSGYVDQVDRRKELARLITDSQQFDQAVVNHFWKSVFAYPLPVAEKNDASLVAHLGDELRASGFDARRLLRWIVLSDAFAMPSRMPAAHDVDAPEFGGKALFSRFYQRKSATESVSTGLAAAAKAHADGSANARVVWYSRFVPQDPTAIPATGTDLFIPVTTPPVVSFDDQEMIKRVSHSGLTYAEKVHHLFWATVTRNPSQQELKLAGELFSANGEDSRAALEAIWLVLTNSDEFVLE